MNTNMTINAAGLTTNDAVALSLLHAGFTVRYNNSLQTKVCNCWFTVPEDMDEVDFNREQILPLWENTAIGDRYAYMLTVVETYLKAQERPQDVIHTHGGTR